MVTKAWIELALSVHDETSEVISNFLFELGSRGCFEREHTLRAYFDQDSWQEAFIDQLNTYIESLRQLGMAVASADIRVSEIPDADWNAVWKQSLGPVVIDADLVIKPSWIRGDDLSQAHVIELDPQMAFGSGMHATTQLVLRAMRPYLRDGISLLDVGTGSGILAIAAARLCNCEVTACDIDPVATATARENAERNRVHHAIRFFTGTPAAIGNSRFDILLANVNRRALEDMMPVLVLLLKDQGVMILSGILTDEIEQMKQAIRQHPLRLLQHDTREEWSALVIKKDETSDHAALDNKADD